MIINKMNTGITKNTYLGLQRDKERDAHRDKMGYIILDMKRMNRKRMRLERRY